MRLLSACIRAVAARHPLGIAPDANRFIAAGGRAIAVHQIVPALLGPYRAGVAHVRSAIRLDARRAALRQRVGVDHSAAAATQAHVVRGNAGFDVDVWRAFGHDGGYRRADRPLQIGVTWLAFRTSGSPATTSRIIVTTIRIMPTPQRFID